MINHYLTWWEKGEEGEFVGEKKLVNTSISEESTLGDKEEISKELERLKLFDSTYSIYPVTTEEQAKYLSNFVWSNFLIDLSRYDFFVETNWEDSKVF